MKLVSTLICAAAMLAAQSFRLYYVNDGFGLRAHGFAETLAGGHQKYYPLPQSSFDDYVRLRPDALKRNPFDRKQYERKEWIGPHQTEGSKIWFGKQFYDSEGSRGVGAFGYFDTESRQYQLYSPPEVAGWEVASMLVEPDRVWLGLDEFIEDISTTPGGLVSWNRETQEVHRYELEFVVTKISREGDSLRLATSGGYALLTGEMVQRFRVRNGKATPIDRFPPPPTHY